VISRGGSPRDYARYAMNNGADTSEFGQRMASQALSYRGMPYIRGAQSPSRGFDCSGLIYYLLRQRGYNPPRTAAGLAGYGKPVSRKSIQPGDIVLFANTYKRGISHVGIYMGNGNFVHAARSGEGVRVDSLSSRYYAGKFWGARRVK
jgi:cell wall-associated NlpC family hydrolase